MTIEQTMTLAIKKATRERDEQAKQCQTISARSQLASAQLAQLKSYLKDTQDQYLRQANRAISAGLLANQHQFMGRLHDAIVQQDRAVQALFAQEERAKLALVAIEQRLSMLDTWLAAKLHAHQVLAARQSQKDNDEMAQNMFRQQLKEEARI